MKLSLEDILKIFELDKKEAEGLETLDTLVKWTEELIEEEGTGVGQEEQESSERGMAPHSKSISEEIDDFCPCQIWRRHK